MKPFTILIYGLGSIGTCLAIALKRAGCEVLAVGRAPHIDVARTQGLKRIGIWDQLSCGPIDARPTAAAFSKQDLAPVDLALFVLKSYDTQEGIDELAPHLPATCPVFSMQNGLGNDEIIAAKIGADRTYIARLIFGAELPEPGVAKFTVWGDDIVAGPLQLDAPSAALALSRRLTDALTQGGLPTKTLPAMGVRQAQWDKLFYNAALNSTGAVLNATYGALAANPGTREIMNNIIAEGHAVAVASGVQLRLGTLEKQLEFFYTKQIPPTAAHFPSTLYDLKRPRSGKSASAKGGRKQTEIGALTGYIVRRGRELGVPTPVAAAMTALVEAREMEDTLPANAR
ncbi:MAG TPA: 2-dehydropantoate 2-reductase [Planctomycetota bacterium]|nr:2-dehydropantoate 2-reductase [Planctomycetota bacterium]